MVLTSDGLVLTNNHVIADATSITAQVNGQGPSYQGDVIGYDITADVAVVQLRNASNLATVSTAKSSEVRVNDRVVALGNALGQGGPPAVASGSVTRLDQTITVGDASGQNQETLSGLIEVDVSLQPGDSGGPLLNLDAEVIGMDTAVFVSGRGGGGYLGYAIPIDDALAIAVKIITGTSSPDIHIGDRAVLGVQIDPVGPGAHIFSVTSGGPAEMAGMAAGDTILSVDGAAVADGTPPSAPPFDPYHPARSRPPSSGSTPPASPTKRPSPWSRDRPPDVPSRMTCSGTALGPRIPALSATRTGAIPTCRTVAARLAP